MNAPLYLFDGEHVDADAEIAASRQRRRERRHRSFQRSVVAGCALVALGGACLVGVLPAWIAALVVLGAGIGWLLDLAFTDARLCREHGEDEIDG